MAEEESDREHTVGIGIGEPMWGSGESDCSQSDSESATGERRGLAKKNEERGIVGWHRLGCWSIVDVRCL